MGCIKGLKGMFLMDKITLEVRDLVNQYLKKLIDNNIHIERALVFGSQVRGVQTGGVILM